MTDAGADADPREITGGDVTAQMGAGSHMHAFAEASKAGNAIGQKEREGGREGWGDGGRARQPS